ncbi:MAG TPA: phage holin family protein [Chthoniobacterales bacterium]|jgi:putative membrane protein
MKSFLLRWLITALSVLVAAKLLDGVTYTSFGALLLAALILGLLNALVRPLLLLLSLPFILVTMGLFILVVNAAVLKLTSGLTPGFQVEGFWTTVFGALIISAVSWALSSVFQDEEKKVRVLTRASQLGGMKQVQGRVIE